MDRTFRTGPNNLDGAVADLGEMSALGYNAVRIWLNACWGGAPGCLGDPAGGLRSEYLANMATYLWAARELGIKVMFTLDDPPEDGGYGTEAARFCCAEFNGFNLDLSAGGVADHERFWTEFVAGLIDAGAPLDAIWAYQLRNEQFYERQLPPFATPGSVTAADGKTYDLTDPAQAHAMRDNGLRHYVDAMVAAIKAVDPTALVTMGFFPSAEGPVAVPADDRLVDPRPLRDSTLDFLDFHAYPGVGLNWEEAWANSLLADITEKPVVLGEFGSFRQAYVSDVDALGAALDFQARACAAGLDGFLYWTWSGQGVYGETWGGDEAGIATRLSPTELRDPCEPGQVHPNLAYGRPATSSAFEDGPEVVGTPAKAVDLSLSTWWSSGTDAPQWISIDLGGATVARVRLLTQQAAESPMRVRVSLLDAGGGVLADQAFTDPPTDADGWLILEHAFDTPVPDVAALRVDTTRLGWVIWYEVEAYGPDS